MEDSYFIVIVKFLESQQEEGLNNSFITYFRLDCGFRMDNTAAQNQKNIPF